MTGPADAATLAAFVDELVEPAIPAVIDDAVAAEGFASGAVAEWLELGGGSLADAVGPTLLGRVIAWIERGERPVADDGDPGWLTDVGTSRIVAATRLADPSEPSELAYVVQFEMASGACHDVAVTVVDGRVVDAGVGAPGLAEAVEGDVAATFVVEPVELARIPPLLHGALDGTDPSELGDRARLDLPLLCRRFGIVPDSLRWARPAEPGAPTVDLTRDPDDDRYAARLIDSALRLPPAEPAPPAVAAAAQHFARLVADANPDATALMAVAGRPRSKSELDQLLVAVGAYLAPVDLSPHRADEQAPIAALEPADWVGVILGLVRGLAPVPLDGAACVQLVNRCPEITTSIPKHEAALVAWAFDRVLYAWERTGVLDEQGALTEAGHWLLPRAAQRRWQPG